MEEMLRVAILLRQRNRLAMTNAECASLLTYLARTDIMLCEDWWFYLSATRMSLSLTAYNQLVEAFVKANNGTAMHVLGQMQFSGVSPNEDTFAAMLRFVDSNGNMR